MGLFILLNVDHFHRLVLRYRFVDRQNYSRCQECNLLVAKDHFHRMRKEIRRFISSVDKVHSHQTKDEKAELAEPQVTSHHVMQHQHQMVESSKHDSVVVERPQIQHGARNSMKLKEHHIQQLDTTSHRYPRDVNTSIPQQRTMIKQTSLPALVSTGNQNLSCSQSQQKTMDSFPSKHQLVSNQRNHSTTTYYGKEEDQQIRSSTSKHYMLPSIQNKVSVVRQQSSSFQLYEHEQQRVQQPMNKKRNDFTNVPSHLPQIPQKIGQPQNEMLASCHYKPRPPTTKRNSSLITRNTKKLSLEIHSTHFSHYENGRNCNCARHQQQQKQFGQREVNVTLQDNSVEMMTTSMESQNEINLPIQPQPPRLPPRQRQKSATTRHRRRVNYSPQHNNY